MRLRREHVVDEAIALLHADGLDALTMRKLATRLGVQAGALYWHFASNQALLDAMADRFLEDFGAGLPAGSWDERLSAAGWRLRQVLLSHRDGARVMAGTYVAETSTIPARQHGHRDPPGCGCRPTGPAGLPLPRSTTCSATPSKNKRSSN
jgi:TetR/AcrR family tetracycline transcriptional repressor